MIVFVEDEKTMMISQERSQGGYQKLIGLIINNKIAFCNPNDRRCRSGFFPLRGMSADEISRGCTLGCSPRERRGLSVLARPSGDKPARASSHPFMIFRLDASMRNERAGP